MVKTNIEKIEGIKAQIRELENQQKKLVQQQKEQERKARTKRLIERGAILESLIDRADTLTNEQIKTLLQIALNTEAAVEKLLFLHEQTNNIIVANPSNQQSNVANPAPARTGFLDLPAPNGAIQKPATPPIQGKQA